MLYFFSIKYSGGPCEVELNDYLIYASEDGAHHFSTLANVWMQRGRNEIRLKLKSEKSPDDEEAVPDPSSCRLGVFLLTEKSEKEFILEHEIAREDIQQGIAAKLSFRNEEELLFDTPVGIPGLAKPWLTDLRAFERGAYDEAKNSLLELFAVRDTEGLIKRAATKIDYLSQLFEEPRQAVEDDLRDQLVDFFNHFTIREPENLRVMTTYEKVHDCGLVRAVDMRGEPGLVGFDHSGEITSGFEIYLGRTRKGVEWVF